MFLRKLSFIRMGVSLKFWIIKSISRLDAVLLIHYLFNQIEKSFTPIHDKGIKTIVFFSRIVFWLYSFAGVAGNALSESETKDEGGDLVKSCDKRRHLGRIRFRPYEMVFHVVCVLRCDNIRHVMPNWANQVSPLHD